MCVCVCVFMCVCVCVYLVCVCVCVCLLNVCVCVLYHPIYSERQTCGRTSRGHTGSRKATRDFSTFRLRCLPSFLSREAFSRPFHSLTLKSNFVYPRIDCSPLVGHDIFILFYFCQEKSQFVENDYLCRGYTKIDLTVDEGERDL